MGFDRDRVRDDLQRLDFVLARVTKRLELVVRIRVTHLRHRSDHLPPRRVARARKQPQLRDRIEAKRSDASAGKVSFIDETVPLAGG